jgi:Cof subfamily protein (haloacid dehalogenase superfamily)
MTYRLLVTDVDGTLLTPDRRILPSVREAVRAARCCGVRVCLATGRTWSSVHPYAEALDIDPPIILFNGGVVHDFRKGRTLLRQTLDPEHARTVLELLRAFPEVQPHLYVDDRIYVGRMNDLTRTYARKDGVHVEAVGDLMKVLPPDPMKILIVGEPEELARVEATIRRYCPDIHAVFSEATYLEILPAGVSKGSALRVLAQAVGVELQETIAVGDNPNDLEMIQTAGLGVAVANAHPDVKAVAQYVTVRPGGEAIAEVIQRFILNGGE